MNLNKQNYILICVSILIALLPSIYVSYIISNVGEISRNDYWGIIPHFYSLKGFSTNIVDWIVKSNEHLVFIPAIIYGINIVLTKGSNIGLCLTAFIFAATQVFILIALLPQNIKHLRVIFILLVVSVSVFSFTPAAAHNWMLGFSGVAWVGANLFVIASIFCLTKLAEEENLAWALSSIAFGILASLTYSTALGLWPVLCFAVVLMGLKKRIVLFYLSSAVIVCGIYFSIYKTPSHHPSPSSVQLTDVATYIPTYIGGIFTSETNIAQSIGVIGCLVALQLFVYWLLNRKKSDGKNSDWNIWLPWLSIQAYALGSAVMAAVSRSSFGFSQALSSRYATLPGLFWLGLIVLTALWMQQIKITSLQRRYFTTSFFLFLTILIILMYSLGIKKAQDIARSESLQPLVSLSVHLGISDADLVKQVITPAPKQFFQNTDVLRSHGLVPFSKNILKDNFCASLDKTIPANLLTSTPQDNTPGYFDEINNVIPNVAKVRGWAGSSNGHIRCVTILNQDDVVRGFAMVGFRRPDVEKVMRSPTYKFSGWTGYIRSKPEDRKFTAYASIKGRKGWVALNNIQNIAD